MKTILIVKTINHKAEQQIKSEISAEERDQELKIKKEIEKLEFFLKDAKGSFENDDHEEWRLY